ncbi:hypothetical protein Tco_0412023 [Tanacetum coccineum]
MISRSQNTTGQMHTPQHIKFLRKTCQKKDVVLGHSSNGSVDERERRALPRMDECHKLLTNKVDWSNPEGHQILRNIYEPLPLGGPPGDKRAEIALSYPSKARSLPDFGLEELVSSLWVGVNGGAGVKADEADELHKFSDGTLTRVMEKLDQTWFKDFHCSSTIMGMENQEVSEETREEARLHHSYRERLQSEGSIEVWESLFRWRK